jgi:hypothetical protein
MIGELTLTADATPMQVAVALPDAGGPHPGVLVAHHRGGVDDFTRSVVARLSANGFAAAPNFFHRRPTGEGADVSVDLLTDAEILADIDATFRHLDAMPEIRTGAVAILGHCLGGRTAFLGAAATGFFHAAVVLSGGKIFLPARARLRSSWRAISPARCSGCSVPTMATRHRRTSPGSTPSSTGSACDTRSIVMRVPVTPSRISPRPIATAPPPRRTLGLGCSPS